MPVSSLEYAVKHRRQVLAVTLLAAAVSLAACSGSKSTTSNAAASNPAAQTSAPATTSPAATSPATTTQTTATTQATGRCSSIDHQTAESILGFTTAAGISASTGGGSGMKKLDGCLYESTTDGSLGYDVLQVNAQFGQAMISVAKAKMAGAGAQVTTFDAGLPNSIAFTQHAPLGVDSQITVLAGDRLITVASTRKDGNVAKAQASATVAAKALIAHS